MAMKDRRIQVLAESQALILKGIAENHRLIVHVMKARNLIDANVVASSEKIITQVAKRHDEVVRLVEEDFFAEDTKIGYAGYTQARKESLDANVTGRSCGGNQESQIRDQDSISQASTAGERV
jgi:hypothetical protein